MSVPTLEGITAETIETPRIRTRLLHCGPADGTPVVFLHGNVSSATFWEAVMLALPDGFRGLAYDQRGYGDADPDKKIDATSGLLDLADDLKALLETLGYEKAHVVGHSAGGSVLWRFLMEYPAMCQSVTLVCPGSPYGFGGTKGLDGQPLYDDFAGSGGGTVNQDFPPLLANNDRSDGEGSPRWTMRTFYGKTPFLHPREEDLLSSMLSTHVGDKDYPGDLTPSENWPNVAPGTFGMVNALSPKYQKDVSALYAIDPKPTVLWVRGAEDQIVSDTSFFDVATLGKMGLVPGWPGEDVAPPQPMIGQTRAVLEQYAAAGGSFQEVVIADAGHSPYLEQPDEFNQTFHTFLQS